MKILILTSRENFVWLSMQEIVPYIEHTWATMDTKKHQITFINIDENPLSIVFKAAIQADQIVSTCFNFKMCKYLLFLRKNAQLNTPMIHYVHNMATIAFWPFRFWGDAQIFQMNDTFIVSCERDVKNMKLVAPSARVFVIPFNFLQQSHEVPGKGVRQVENILFIGRLSPQKNLHILILAYSRLVKKLGRNLPSLVFYGKEDHLGSPNMNLKNQTYLNFLQNLVLELSVEDKVHFMGYRDRNEIRLRLENEFNLLVSPSLHSDENFGMVILQTLLCNNDCLISDWGGHADFKVHFPNQVELIPVRPSKLGPTVNPQELADCLEAKILSGGRVIQEFRLPAHYHLTSAHATLEALLENFDSSEALAFSQLADHLLKKIIDSNPNYNQTQIFESFADPIFHRISATYMNHYLPFSASKIFDFEMVPWAQVERDKFFVNDPHRGPLVFSKTEMTKLELVEIGYLF